MHHQPADLVLVNGRVLTLDQHATETTALAVAGDRILAAGTDDDIRALTGHATTVIDLAGRTVLPGINDAHLHLSLLGLAMPPHVIDLSPQRSLEDLQRTLATAAATTHGEWLIGTSWSEGEIAEFADRARPPHRHDLDPHSGDRPVALHHISKHGVWANTAALRIAGITSATPDPEGGIIVRDADGEPTGLLLETASELLTAHIPPAGAEQRQEALRAALRLLNSLGITSLTDPMVSPDALRDLVLLRRSGELTVRTSVLMYWDSAMSTSLEKVGTGLRTSGLAAGLGDEWLRIGGVKVFSDGVPSQGTAWTYQPYHHDCTGGLTTPGADDTARYDELLDIIEVVHRNRMHAQVHATGDRAVDAVIDGVLRAQSRDPWPDARHAILHGTLIKDPLTMRRLADHGIGVVTSSVMKAGLAAGLRSALGEEGAHATFLAGSLLAAGVQVADSSDAPVVPPDWRRGLQTLVTGDGYGARAATERLTRTQALRLWTNAGASLESAEHTKGSLEPGKLADFVVLAEDLHSVADHELSGLTPQLTYVGGACVFDSF
ncbi:amidohydrolase [Nonomuraea sp. NPDC026600]|uniref:amidohydrolase n=1 Tax=Nonomuraea sp. NPDC026600 TaxID=3155363 RepID=UPI0033FF1174